MKECLIIIAVTLVGGFVPLLFKLTDRLLHGLIALATGVFLGAVFLHLLPALSGFELQEEELDPPAIHAEEISGSHTAGDKNEEHAHDTQTAHSHSDHSTAVWMFVLIGVLAVYLVEALAFRVHDHDELHRHRAVSYAALTGLSIHAFTAGIGFSAAASQGLAGVVLLALVCHKAFESFSLTTVFTLAHAAKPKIIAMVIAFSLATPLGILLGNTLTGVLSDFGIAIFTALAAGTFLYVCLCELLPEVFHHREDSIAKIALLVFGIGSMALLHEFGA